MPHRRFGAFVEEIAVHRLPRQGLETQRGHETLRRRGHDDAYRGAGFAETAYDFERLVRRDATGDD